jgi:hypothetical protein
MGHQNWQQERNKKGRIMTLKRILQILCAGAFASTAIITTQAQTPSRAQQQRGITDPDFEQQQRDLRLVDKMKGGTVNKPVKRHDPKVVAAELAEDFTRLQVVNNDLVGAATGSAPLKLEFVVKSTAELVERSKRLAENLGHPEPEKGSTPPKLDPVTDVEQLKHSLETLDKLVTEFTQNPLFKEANTRDAELFVKARNDLAAINALSEHLKKNVEEMNKVKP